MRNMIKNRINQASLIMKIHYRMNTNNMAKPDPMSFWFKIKLKNQILLQVMKWINLEIWAQLFKHKTVISKSTETEKPQLKIKTKFMVQLQDNQWVSEVVHKTLQELTRVEILIYLLALQIRIQLADRQAQTSIRETIKKEYLHLGSFNNNEIAKFEFKN